MDDPAEPPDGDLRRSRGGRFLAFWKTLPGVLTGSAAVVGAVVSVLALTAPPSDSETPDPGPTTTTTTTVAPNPNPNPDPRPTPQPVPVTTAPTTTTSTTEPPELARVSLLVGVRPQFGQLTEDLALSIDGTEVTRWSADRSTPSQLLDVDIGAEGPHDYEISGTYTYADPLGNTLTATARGTGRRTFRDHEQLGVAFYPATQSFALAPR